jgi:hypothetical protein
MPIDIDIDTDIDMVSPRNRRSYKRPRHSAIAIRLRALLRGYQHQLARVDQAILEIRRQIGEAPWPTAQGAPDGPQAATAVMKRIAAARKGRQLRHPSRDR